MVAEILLNLAGDLLTGANIPFVASFALALLFTVMSVIGAGDTETDADAEVSADADVGHDVEFDHDVDVDVDTGVDLSHDVDVDTDVDFSHDVDMDTDVDFSHDAEIDTEVDFEHDVDVSHDLDVDGGADVDHDVEAVAEHPAGAESISSVTLSDILLFFGVGRVPLSILLMSFSYAFGVTGWVLNTLAAGPGGDVGPWFAASLGGACAAGMTTMRVVSRAIIRYLPTTDVSGFARRQLVGLRGVAGLPVDEHAGRAQVTDGEGTRHQVRCRVVPGGQPLPKGSKVILVKYVAKDDLYYVAADRRR